MISKFTSVTTKWLLKSGAISEEDEEIYEYTAYSLIFGMLPLLLSAIVGIIFGMFAESVFMIIPFILIRKFCGGFHLKSATVCFFGSLFLITTFMFFVKYALANKYYSVTSWLVTAAALQIFLCSPISSENRPLERNEYIVFKKISRIIITAFVILYVCLLMAGFDKIALSVGFGIILTALLQLPCVVIGLVKAISNIRA